MTEQKAYNSLQHGVLVCILLHTHWDEIPCNPEPLLKQTRTTSVALIDARLLKFLNPDWNVSNCTSVDWVSMGRWPIDTGRQVDSRLIKKRLVWCFLSLWINAMSKWISIETDKKGVTQALMTEYARLGQSFWCELLTKHIHRVRNWNTKTIFSWWSSLMNSR